MSEHAFLEFRPDPDDGTPLYLQVARLLSNAINAGRFRVNDALPAERVLAESLGISRVTARAHGDRRRVEPPYSQRIAPPVSLCALRMRPRSRILDLGRPVHSSSASK